MKINLKQAQLYVCIKPHILISWSWMYKQRFQIQKKENTGYQHWMFATWHLTKSMTIFLQKECTSRQKENSWPIGWALCNTALGKWTQILKKKVKMTYQQYIDELKWSKYVDEFKGIQFTIYKDRGFFIMNL